MIATLSHLARLARAGFVLAREGVFALPDPRQLPVPARAVIRLARLIERPTSASVEHRLSTALTRLGPTYVKLGQFLATRLNRQMSMIQRPVRYAQLGVGVGKTFDSTLVTGNIVVQNQERLQFEALNGPIALGVADVVMKEFSRARRECGGIVADLLTTAALAPAPAPAPSPLYVRG